MAATLHHLSSNVISGRGTWPMTTDHSALMTMVDFRVMAHIDLDIEEWSIILDIAEYDITLKINEWGIILV